MAAIPRAWRRLPAPGLDQRGSVERGSEEPVRHRVRVRLRIDRHRHAVQRHVSAGFENGVHEHLRSVDLVGGEPGVPDQAREQDGVVLSPGDEAVPAAVEPEAGEPPSEADALSDEAVAAFKAKDYDTAIAKFQRAYEIDPQPNYKFNIGRVYEEKGDLENAVKYYQEFVQSPGVDLEAREAATAQSGQI